jgi:lipopolysaccharide transport system permease protein
MALTGVLNDLSHFVLSVPIICVMMAWYGITPMWDCIWAFPVLLFIQLFFTLGLTLNLERLIGILTMLWFYVTPVLFKEDWVPERLQWTNYANPMASIVITWRHIFMGTPIELSHIAVAGIWAAVAFGTGYLLFRRLNWRFAELV